MKAAVVEELGKPLVVHTDWPDPRGGKRARRDVRIVGTGRGARDQPVVRRHC
jgi:hypothetical protein